jgi:hypothetical protein
LEDTEEIERLYKKENGTKDVTFFTSALYFSFENEWRWMSESSKILLNGILFPLEKIVLVIEKKIEIRGGGPRLCKNFEFTKTFFFEQ